MPTVSVVILSFGHVEHTLGCLATLEAAAQRISGVEVIVSDDCSGDRAVEVLSRIAGLRLLRTPENLAFVQHANWAVAQSEGRYVLLLNNDTELRAHAIDTLVETAGRLPDIGVLGPKLIYPDGRLQEAGGVIWRDGSAWNYGCRGDPEHPEHNYLRDTDYISGAAILVPREVWDRVGGFDEAFHPAYCEDSDFAFRVREAGLRVVYQPAAVVVHHEGVTHGVDVTAGVKASQVVNQRRLRTRWRSTLDAEHWKMGEHLLRARDRAKRKRVALVVDHYVPEPDRDAGSRTIATFVEALQADGYLVKFWPDNLRLHPTYTARLQQAGVETMYAGPWSMKLRRWLRQNGEDLDLILMSRPLVAANCMPLARKYAPRAKLVYYGHDLHFARLRGEAQMTSDPALAEASAAIEAVERRVWRQADLVLYPSDCEVAAVRAMEPKVTARTVTPYAFAAGAEPREPPSGDTLLFVAGFAHPPNVDAAEWLVERILPIIRRERPHVRLCLAGSDPAERVLALAGPEVEVTGYVADQELARRYGQARVAIAPLRFGAGVKLKVVEAMNMGIPLVTTPVGAQGIPGLAEVAAVCDEPGALANACISLLGDDALWRQQSADQTAYVRQRFSADAARVSLRQAIDSIPTPNRLTWLRVRRAVFR
jgi:GT2 family glycosyltransferase